MRRLVQALQTDRLEIARHVGLDAAGRDRIFVCDFVQSFISRVSTEGGPAGEQLVQDRPKRVNVRGRADVLRLAACLFGGYVGRGAEKHTGPCMAGVAIEAIGRTEVGDLRYAKGPFYPGGFAKAGRGLAQQHVARFQVAMDDAALVGHGDGTPSVSTSSAASRAGCGEPATRRASVGPFTNSRARNGRPSISPTS